MDLIENPVSPSTSEVQATTPRRRRRRRRPSSPSMDGLVEHPEASVSSISPDSVGETASPSALGEQAAAPRRRRRRRGRKSSEDTASREGAQPPGSTADIPSADMGARSTAEPTASTDGKETAPRRSRGRRRKTPTSEETTKPSTDGRESHYEALAEQAELPSPRERRAADLSSHETGAPEAHRPFAHPAEEEIARLLDFYGVKWLYEPRSFPLRWDGNRVVEMFTPDFYLPEEDLYVELTTLKQSLVTEKNRKLRHLRELYPDTNIKLLYRRDIHRLLAKYGYGPLAEVDVQQIERVLFTKPQIERRVAELGRQISKDYTGEQPVLVGVLRGVICFMSDLIRQITLPLSIDLMSISYFGGSEDSGVHITKDLDIDLSGRHVLLVEDIVDTGMTLNYLLHYLASRNPSSLKVCTLLDKRVRRLADVKLDYAGFEVPDEFLVGYGLDCLEKYRNLPFIGILKPTDQQPAPRRDRRRRSPK